MASFWCSAVLVPRLRGSPNFLELIPDAITFVPSLQTESGSKDINLLTGCGSGSTSQPRAKFIGDEAYRCEHHLRIDRPEPFLAPLFPVATIRANGDPDSSDRGDDCGENDRSG